MNRLNKSYYCIKPFIPRRIQIIIRRKMVLRKALLCKDVWPIDEKASNRRDMFSGWPEQRRFALVLMHDVDTAKGHDKSSELMNLEKGLGFRSSFNFVPERYNVSPELRLHLRGNGFEVGVHGLKHDGKLYQSHKRFQKRAIRINQFIKEWGSVGFSSPATHHKLDWLHELNIQYDASTFDTDPFEPQSDGVGTIFPFWVPRNNASDSIDPTGRESQVASREGLTDFSNIPLFHHSNIPVANDSSNSSNSINSSNPEPSSSKLQSPRSSLLAPGARLLSDGYVELPYTLPQDFTLFVIMQEKNIDIWKRKLDWIVENGGMALLDAHPDYIDFDGNNPGLEEYPVHYYEEFLHYIKNKYEGQYWHALPKDIARFWAMNRSTQDS
jgi:hypothetical protein